MQHIIRKQLIELTLTSKKDAFRLQEMVSGHYWRDILRVLENAFDNATATGETIHIDRLEIDLGIINEQHIIKGRWGDLLFKKISEKLNQLKHSQLPGIKTTRQPEMINAADQWLFYMQQGYLPWNVKAVSEAWYISTLQAFASNLAAIAKLRYAVLRHPQVVKRIVLQHKVDFIISLLEAITSRNQKNLPVIIDELIQVFVFLNQWSKKELMARENFIEKKIWQEAILYSARHQQQSTPEGFIQILVDSGYYAAGSIETLPQKFLAVKRITGSILHAIKTKAVEKEKTDNNRTLKKDREMKGKIRRKKNNDDNVVSDGRVSLRELIAVGDFSEIKTDKDLKIDSHLEDDAIYVQHAGLVLLHVFLKPFFNNLGLLGKTDFIDIASRQKALFLIYFLATGKTIAAEHELVIEKLLCAYPLQMPVPSAIALQEEECNEAVEMLRNVIQHWKILKNTSVEGLRESFLQRKGKLSTGNDGPVLQIERSSIDILLDDIPWNYSLIQLPWRKDLIRVEW